MAETVERSTGPATSRGGRPGSPGEPAPSISDGFPRGLPRWDRTGLRGMCGRTLPIPARPRRRR
ncbi:MAG: hypothetical protein OXG81_13605 [Acidobacteria bacterium]|nr:hypothetical protein [Acidobacteriota bacterium]